VIGMKKMFACAWMALLLTACASTGISESQKPSPDKGVVFASVLFSGTYSENSILIRPVGDARVIRIGLGEPSILIPVLPKGDFADIGYDKMGKKGAVLAEELPPGDYEVFDWRVKTSSRTIASLRQFSIPFKVEAGKAVYLGSYSFTHRGYMIGDVKVVAEDLLARDAAIFDGKFQGYKDMEKKNFAPAEVQTGLGKGAAFGRDMPALPLMIPAHK
jgi:hypothetical protein